MKNSLRPLTLLLFSLLLLLPMQSMAEDLNTILELNAKAHGGVGNWEKIENLRMQLEISEPGFNVSGTYVATRDGNMRMDIKITGGPRIFSEGLYKNQAWKWSPLDGVTSQTETAAAALRHGIEMPGRFFTLQEMPDRGATVTLQGDVEDGERQQWQVRLTLGDGFSRDFFIDKETHRVTRERDHRALHPDVDPTEVTVETRYQDEHLIDDVLRFDRSDATNVETGEWLGTTKVNSVEHNIKLSDNYFDPEQ